MRTYQNTYFTDAGAELELKPQRNKQRSYIAIQNRSANSIYINYGTHADVNNGQEIQSFQTFELDRGVPNDHIFIVGAAVASASPVQKVGITEGYREAHDALTV